MSSPEKSLSEDDSKAAHGSLIRSMIRILVWVGLGSFSILCGLPLALIKFGGAGEPIDEAAETAQAGAAILPWTFLLKAGMVAVAAAAATAGLYYVLKKTERFADADAALEARFLDTLDPKYVDLAILASAALSLFLELALIRWQGTVLEFLAFYKNFSLLACFAGLGLGYALANRSRIPLLLVLPLLCWQFLLMMITRSVPDLFHAIPFREELAMGISPAGLPRTIVLFVLLTVIFLLTALTFIPVGQLCGRLMEQRPKLRAYGLNLAGSLLGVVLMLVASFLWTPPLVWFALCFLALLAFHVRRPVSLFTGIAAAIIATITLSWWPVDPLWNRVYSPYQMLELGTNDGTGLTLIRAAGFYYQRIHDLSSPSLPPPRQHIRDYYDFPYKMHPVLNHVAVVGAGTGNDVAAALRGGARAVDAIEIDPAILLTGKNNHPEKPYQNPRTHAIVNDARSFLRNSAERYDLIVYGLLDSHTLLSQGSSVRLDSFVYTVEGLREARSRLEHDGVISLAFAVLSDNLGRKIYLMMQEAFDGRPPVCVKADYDGAIIFFESNDPNSTFPSHVVTDSGFTDVSVRYANPALHADVSTDDWPFFYMPQRVYPASYVVAVLLILLLSALLGWNFFGEAPQFNHLSFFFLGAGFMLIETKGITEMGLTFGNTWQVIGVVIAGILTMAFLGNCAVALFGIRRPIVPYFLLWAALLVGWYVARSGGFASTPLGRVGTAIVLTSPLLFSGVVFSTLLTRKGQVSGMMAMNLLGAICGGLLEYNSMYFGFQWLYLAAMACYFLALLSDLVMTPRPARITAPAAA